MPPRDLSAGDHLTRRGFLRLGAVGLTLPEILRLQAAVRAGAPGAAGDAPGRATSCIVLFAWGGTSHLDTWDPKPEAEREIRGEFKTIPTSVSGLRISEHLPRLARQAHRLAVVRSVTHEASDHREAAYWNLTGHRPRLLGQQPILPGRADWPAIGAQVTRALHVAPAVEAEKRRRLEEQIGLRDEEELAETRLTRDFAAALPRTVTLPYPVADRGLLNGQFGGFLGAQYDPAFIRPVSATPYKGVSPRTGHIDLELARGLTRARFSRRRRLLAELEAEGSSLIPSSDETLAFDLCHRKALDMLAAPAVRAAFDLRQEPRALREKYGEHICGQSTLLARRLTDAGVPLVTVNCSAGDLNSGGGDHWDTHGNNFNRLKNDLLPPLDRAGATLIEDLADRGRLDETLVVFLTEFGRTPKINGGAGRDHYPSCYSVVFAGGGIGGGRVYGRSDRTGSRPAESPCGPEDLHATIFHSLGIDPHFVVTDLDGRPLPLTDGEPLPLF